MTERTGSDQLALDLSTGTMPVPMEMLTVGYEDRTLPQLVRMLQEQGVTRLVDIREHPFSRRPGFSSTELFEATRRAGIVYELRRELGNPKPIRDVWRSGDIETGRSRYRKLLRNGRRSWVEFLIQLAGIDRVAILCYEQDHERCHRSIVAEEAVEIEPGLRVSHL